MPRLAGQIDVAKNEAILDAAVEVLAERGLSAPTEAIARRASVSKQTIYNHYGGKTALVRALVTRRVEYLTAPLREPGAQERPEETLAAYARILLESICSARNYSLIRMTIQGADGLPETAREVFEAGPRASRAKLAAFLAAETGAGRMAVEDPDEAAEFFSGMCIGHRQIRALIGLDLGLDEAGIERLARRIAHRFMRAYAV